MWRDVGSAVPTRNGGTRRVGTADRKPCLT